MSIRIRVIAGLTVAALAALWWIVAMAVQQAAEPFTYAENNTYWLRDVRWLAGLAIAVALVWTFRGDRFMTGVAAAVFAAAIAMDIVVDRLNTAAAGAVVLLLLTAWFAGRGREIRPSRSMSAMASGFAIAGSATAAAMQSPTDLEWSLNPSAVLLCLVLAMCALGCGMDAAGGGTRYGHVVAAATLVVGSGVLIAARMESPKFTWPAVGLMAVLFVGATMILLGETSPWSLRIGLGLLNCAVAMFALLFFTLVSISMQPGAPFTTWAGNPGIGGDEDVSMALVALASGVLLGGMFTLERILADGRHEAKRRNQILAAE
ncbi:MAG: hypothetical protein ACRD0P_23440 [Stackebrandtia sp.]